LKNHLSEYLRGLRPGQVIAITDRGRVVAELRSTAGTNAVARPALTGRYATLVETGVIRPAREAGDPLEAWPTLKEVKLPAGSAAALIDEDRGG
jgi:antitoxin (DNA-binding transcriptional repressor) of toxin-antitoxin stability system